MWNAWMANWDLSEIDLWTLSAQSRTWIDLRSLSSWIRVLVWMAHRHQFIPSKCCPVCDVKPTSRHWLMPTITEKWQTNKQSDLFAAFASAMVGVVRPWSFITRSQKTSESPHRRPSLPIWWELGIMMIKIILILLAIAPNFIFQNYKTFLLSTTMRFI